MTADTLAALLAARATDDRPGLRFEDRTWTWREYVARCRAVADWLSRTAGVTGSGTAGGVHVGVLCDNVPEFAFLLGAAAISPHVVVALNPTRSVVELERDARATDVDLVVWGAPYRDQAQHVGEALGVPVVPAEGLGAVGLGVPGVSGGPRVPGPGEGVSGVPGPGQSVPRVSGEGPGADRVAPGSAVPPLAVPAQRVRPGEPEAQGAPRDPEAPGASGDAEAQGEAGSPGELVMLIFTSGTAGRARAVRVTQRKVAVPGVSLGQLLSGDDVVYCPMPLFHSGAVMAAYAPAVASGAALVLRRRFSASGLLPDIRRYRVTYLHYVGKALSYVLATPERPDDASNTLKLAFGNEGSASATRRFGERFGCHVVDAFGSTETAISISPDPTGPKGSLGRLPEGIEIRDPFTGKACPPAELVDGRLANPDEAIGELVNVTGLGLFEGYYNDPEADAERIRQGAFWSGDLAYADKSGYVFFAGRGTERLRVDGENLAVAPIEAALREYPGVVEAAVYPVPDAAAGDQVMAALILDGPFDGGSFAAFLADRADLGTKALPRYIRVCREFPLTASQKIIKRLLAKEGWRTTDPVWWRPAVREEFRLMGERDLADIEEAFVRHGRHDLLEG
ncbi:AMP-binding protein [Nonomuraea sediminis]|uniref:AMP-binding protein n=1 Tax=Nonomuraea sediminis TaxID=2835864 RepID=UPI002029CE52|nr:AMP-binding protein [Nonomuraea sediminis]